MRKTSLEAYNNIKANGLLSERRWQVYDILFHHGPLTAHEVVAIAREKHPLANQTGFNARLSEMERTGCVEIVGEKTNPVSQQLNKLWDVTDKLPLKLEKPKKTKCKSCDGRGYHVEQQARLF